MRMWWTCAAYHEGYQRGLGLQDSGLRALGVQDESVRALIGLHIIIICSWSPGSNYFVKNKLSLKIKKSVIFSFQTGTSLLSRYLTADYRIQKLAV